MGCCHYFEPRDGGGERFTVEMPRTTFGRGCLDELGSRSAARGIRRAALFTDAHLVDSVHLSTAKSSLARAGIDFEVFSEVRIEPTDLSILTAARFFEEGGFDGAVSVGGGSVIDTTKAAMVYALYGGSFETYFAPPVGGGVPVPGALKPHFACPTTCGTGSEATPLSVVRFESLNTKFVLVSRHLTPTEAILDPSCIDTLPPAVIASSGFDLLSHAIECYTARAYTQWDRVEDPAKRVPIQGANPWSDLHAREALRIVGANLERAVTDASDAQARGKLMWGATLAGMAFGNTGTHLPHALSYAVSQTATDFKAEGYPGSVNFVPHGVSVIVNSPSVFRFTAQAAPERHLEAAQCLGAETGGATPDDAGEVVADRIISLMRATNLPNGLGGMGLAKSDAGSLADSASRQKRAIGNAPRDTSRDDVQAIYEGAVNYW